VSDFQITRANYFRIEVCDYTSKENPCLIRGKKSFAQPFPFPVRHAILTRRYLCLARAWLKRVKRNDFDSRHPEHRFAGKFVGDEFITTLADSRGQIQRITSGQSVFFASASAASPNSALKGSMVAALK
jgi:hypothetical protein